MTPKFSAAVETVDPSIARQYLESNVINRKINERALASLSQDMKAGDWKLTGEAIKFDTNNRLIDGQHRLTAIERTGVTVPMLVIRGIEPETQLVLDTGTKRSGANALEIAGITKETTLRAAIAAVGITDKEGMLTTSGSSLLPVTHSQIVEWVVENDLDSAIHFGTKLHRLVAGSRSAICYAFFKIAQVNPESARNFFDEVSSMHTNGIGDPRYTLVNKLNKEVFRGTGYRSKYVFSILKAWEAYYLGRELKIIRDTTLGRATAMPDIRAYVPGAMLDLEGIDTK